MSIKTKPSAELINKDTLQSKDRDKKEIDYYRIENSICHIAGQVLTVIDAAIGEKQQNKATKDLVKGHIAREIRKWQKFYWDKEAGHSIINKLERY